MVSLSNHEARENRPPKTPAPPEPRLASPAILAYMRVASGSPGVIHTQARRGGI